MRHFDCEVVWSRYAAAYRGAELTATHECRSAAVKVTITGGAGFIGANLARELLARGAQVRVVDNLLTGS